MTPLLSVEEVAVEVQVGGQPRRIVSGMSLTVGAGEALGVIGESGSGKSITARTIVRNLPEHTTITGSITFAGEDVLSMPPRRLRRYRRREVGMVFQDPRAHINPVRTIGDFLTEIVCADGLSKRAARKNATALLDSVRVAGAASVLNRYPHELSGGMLQRVMIAGAIAPEPDLLIADEPTTALDVTTQAEVMAILGEMRTDRGMALLFITHDLDLASAICDRVTVAYAGRTVEEQRAASMTRNPRHPYTSALLGARPSLSGDEGKLKTLRGNMISAWEAPTGCAFAPRCDFVEDACTENEQHLVAVGEAMVACRRADELHEHHLLRERTAQDV